MTIPGCTGVGVVIPFPLLVVVEVMVEVDKVVLVVEEVLVVELVETPKFS